MLNLPADVHIKYLEKLCDQFYFNRFYNNGHGDEYFDIIYKDPKLNEIQNHEFLHQGTAVANFIFNRLDYILWKDCNNDPEIHLSKIEEKDQKFHQKFQDEFKNFKFTARNSVEHFYPQNPRNGEVLDSVDCFGNLCLITHGQNSSLNNQMPNDKKQDYLKSTHRSVSIKQMLMMTYENWSEKEIKEHGKAMIKLLNQHICTTQSDA
ncbi:HNH endonuclease family protein [Moraxella sp. FZFQ2102]|uniref:HNH endonuclease family protein n=1 Tax=Moraxella sp. FZFQ2102 TaxID=2953752 RepID=UPI00209C4B2F|nr:HNH endonuclease family protein [Moraxella sp. FZFQ2102]USZ14749.1 HNH endonuclease family protein [Moraxella sp. FZFQ2102]